MSAPPSQGPTPHHSRLTSWCSGGCHWTLRCQAARLCLGLDRKCTFAFHSRHVEPPTCHRPYSGFIEEKVAEEGTSHSAPETGQFLGEQREHHDRAPRVPGWGWTRPVNGTLDVASVGDPLAEATAGTARDPSWCSRSSLTITPPPESQVGDKVSAGPGRQGPGTRREEAEGPTGKKQKAGWRGPPRETMGRSRK